MVLYPEGWKKQWNGCRDAPNTEAHRLQVNDVGFLSKIVGHERQRYGLESGRTYAAGLSNGGQMAHRLATERPDLFLAVAAIVAQQPERRNSRCLMPKGAVSALIMNGTEDPLIANDGVTPSFYGLTPAAPVQSMAGSLQH